MEEVSSGLSGMKRKMGSSDVSEADQTSHTNPLYCSICDVMCNSTAMMENHVNGKKHKKKMLGQSGRTITTWEFWCDSCLIGCNSDANMKMHLDGKMHKANQESWKKRRSQKVEIKKEDPPNCNEVPKMEEEKEDESTNKLIKPVGTTEETCNYEEEELKVEEEGTKKEFGDEKTQDEANKVITDHEEEQVKVRTVEKDEEEDTEMEAKVGMGSNNLAMSINTSGKDGLWCDICELQCNSHLMMWAHRSGKKHTAKQAKAGHKVNKVDQEDLQQEEMMREMEEKNKELWCLICKVTCDTQANMAKHLKGAEHKAKVTSSGYIEETQHLDA